MPQLWERLFGRRALGSGSGGTSPLRGSRDAESERSTAADLVPLWRDPPFVLFYVGNLVSFAGMQITRIALPILIYQLTGSALQTALLVTVQAVPNFAFGLVAGAVADRVDRRVLMIGCNAANGVILASIPLLDALDALTIERLYLAAFLSASAYVFSEAADFGALPAIVGRARLVPATSLVHATWTITGIVALPVGGVLAATLGAGPTLWINAGSYLFIAGVLPLVRRPFNLGAAASDARGRIRRTISDIAEGLRFVRRHEVLWPLTVLGVGSSMATGAAVGLLVVYGVRHLGLAADDSRLGLLYAAGAVGALGAAIALPRLVDRISRSRILVGGLVANTALLAALALAPTLPVGIGLLLLWEGVITLTALNAISLRQQVTPDGLQSRVNTTGRLIAAAGQSSGAALGGLLADALSIQTTYLIMAAAVGLTAVLVAVSPLRYLDAAAMQRYMTLADTSSGRRR
ncbi:MAG: MFS transporter [Pseudonocardiales bacterium]